MTVKLAERLDAMQSGRTAGATGSDVTVCPYDLTGDDSQRALGAAWVRAYVTSSPDALSRVSFDG